ncbi:MAG: MltA domain-containing protein [Pseudomonadota bacterium]
MGRLSRAAATLALLLAAGCALQPPLPPPQAPETPDAPPPPAAGMDAPTPPASALPLLRPRARWVPVDWSSLPGLADDQPAALWPALRAGCARPAPGWAEVCARALAFQPPDDTFAWQFLQRELQPYRLESLDGSPDGLATGYFEPLVAATRTPQPGFAVPLHRPPADLAQRRPWYTRQQIDTLPAAQAALRGQAIAWVASPLDALLLQIQGSGRLRITEPDGRVQTVRLAYAGHNDQPYRSVGRWLIDQGELRADGASWPAIRQWGQQAGALRLQQMLWANPRVVFFKEEPLPDERLGPRGAQGVPLTAGRSVAVDPLAVPYGTPLWISTTEPLSAAPLRRLVMAQDTGSAITGAVRVDYFWGAGDNAEQQAGRMKQPLQVWALWPR